MSVTKTIIGKRSKISFFLIFFIYSFASSRGEIVRSIDIRRGPKQFVENRRANLATSKKNVEIHFFPSRKIFLFVVDRRLSLVERRNQRVNAVRRSNAMTTPITMERATFASILFASNCRRIMSLFSSSFSFKRAKGRKAVSRAPPKSSAEENAREFGARCNEIDVRIADQKINYDMRHGGWNTGLCPSNSNSNSNLTRRLTFRGSRDDRRSGVRDRRATRPKSNHRFDRRKQYVEIESRSADEFSRRTSRRTA